MQAFVCTVHVLITTAVAIDYLVRNSLNLLIV